MHRTSLVLFTCMFLLIIYPVPALAQVNWWRTDSKPAVSLEISKIQWNDFHGMQFFNTVGFLGSQFAVSPSVSILVELPFANYDIDHQYWTDWFSSQGLHDDSYREYLRQYFQDQTAIGNPYIGVEIGGPERSTVYRYGLRLPIASEKKGRAEATGSFGAWDRFEAFAPKVFTISAANGWRIIPREGRSVTAQIMLGPSFMAASGGDPELFFDYWGLIGVRSPLAHVSLTLDGRFLATESGIDFKERFVHHFGLAAGLSLGRFEPGAHFKIPLDDDLNDFVSYTWGLEFAAHL